jgi:hypothetical protein
MKDYLCKYNTSENHSQQMLDFLSVDKMCVKVYNALVHLIMNQ